jgi:hypothetical protein
MVLANSLSFHTSMIRNQQVSGSSPLAGFPLEMNGLSRECTRCNQCRETQCSFFHSNLLREMFAADGG